MTIPNGGDLPVAERVTTIFEFPATPTRVPLYTNTCLVNISGNDIFIDFGFLDTYPAPDERKRVNERGEQIISVIPVTRVSLNLQIASTLYRQLGNLFDIIANIDSKTGDNNDTQE